VFGKRQNYSILKNNEVDSKQMQAKQEYQLLVSSNSSTNNYVSKERIKNLQKWIKMPKKVELSAFRVTRKYFFSQQNMNGVVMVYKQPHLVIHNIKNKND
jgi:hypothetical protein